METFSAGRPPGPELDNCTDRESYSLAAGLALGLVMFGVRITQLNFCLVHVYICMRFFFYPVLMLLNEGLLNVSFLFLLRM